MSPSDHVGAAIALEPGGGERLVWLGEPTAIKVTGEETGGRYATVEVECTPSGFVPLHVHHREDEAFYVLEGEVTFRVGDEMFDAGPGSFVFGPRGVPHAYTLNTPTARMLMQFSPAGFEGFIRATAEPIDAEPAVGDADEDMEAFMALVAEYGCEILEEPGA